MSKLKLNKAKIIDSYREQDVPSWNLPNHGVGHGRGLKRSLIYSEIGGDKSLILIARSPSFAARLSVTRVWYMAVITFSHQRFELIDEHTSAQGLRTLGI
jgi:hypothetical protein